MSHPSVEFWKDSPSPQHSGSSGTYQCSMDPDCEWNGDCKGNHSYSPRRFEEPSVDGPLEDVNDVVDDCQSGEAICNFAEQGGVPVAVVDGEVAEDSKEAD